MSLRKHKNQKQKKVKTKVVVGVYLFTEKNDGFIIPTVKSYPRNG